MVEQTTIEPLLRRDYLITVGALTILVVISWIYVASGAGLGMRASDVSTFALFPHANAPAAMAGMAMGAQAWAPATWALVIAMWWVMMIAMMSPSAAPAILLYARVHRHSVAQGQVDAKLAPTGAFAAGYLLAWLAFSVAAASLQWLLVQTGLVSEIMMGSQSRWLSGALLITAGLYQLSPLKGLCLEHCRSPTKFLTNNWRPGAGGAARLGILHGIYCVGCCWTLMALLFVGGVMNLIWIAVLSILVLVEKLTSVGPILARGLGILLVIWGGATLLV